MSNTSWTPADEACYQKHLELVESFNAAADKRTAETLEELARAGYYILRGDDGFSLYAFDGDRLVVEGRDSVETCVSELNKIFEEKRSEDGEDEETAMLAGMAFGCGAYNDVKGY